MKHKRSKTNTFRLVRAAHANAISNGGVRVGEPRRFLTTAARLAAVNRAGRDFSGLQDIGTLLKAAVTCLRNDLGYRDAFIVLEDAETPRPPCGQWSERIKHLIRLGDEVFGTLVIPHCSYGTLHNHDHEVLETFTTFLAVSLRNLRCRDDLLFAECNLGNSVQHTGKDRR